MERECGPSGARVRVCCVWFEMGSPPRGLRLLEVVVAFLLAGGCSGSSSSPHSLRYFYTALSEPGQGLPLFVQVGLVDNQPITRYNSNTRRKVPAAPWMEKVVEDEAGYWESSTQILQGAESEFRADLGRLQERFNQQNSTGLHTWQLMYGCEVGPDGQPRGGYHQYAYDGEDFLAFDKGTVSWTASVAQAEISRQMLDKQLDNSYRLREYLEKTCVEWLRRYLDYGNETLQRTERPTVRVVRKKAYDGQETLFCHLYGFYPKEIEVTWMKDKEDQKPETWTGGVVPNSDGTYNTWLSIDVDPKERNRYQCRVGHNSLLEPLDLAWEEPASNLGLIVGVVVGVVLTAVLLGIVGVVFYRRKRRKNYEAVSKKQPLEDGIEVPPKKQPPEDLYTPMLRSSKPRTDSSISGISSQSSVASDGGSSQSSDASDGYSDQESDSTKAPVRRDHKESSNSPGLPVLGFSH